MTIKEKENKVYETMKASFGYKNKMAAPRLLKVVINSGTGSGLKKDKNRNDLLVDRLTKITGQKATTRLSKHSIASFKLRQGEPIGVMVTLRGHKMYSFLDKFFNIAIPRTKDFRGLDSKSIDQMGNLTLSVKEHTIFPETVDEELKDVFGLAVTLVASTKNPKEALAFYTLLGVPFKK